MDWASRLGLIFFISVAGAVGAALLLRGLRRRAVPELALGAVLVFGGPLGYGPTVLAWSGGLPAALHASVQAVAQLGLELCAASLLLFNVWVFRPGSRVARGVAGGASLAMGAAWVVLLADGAFAGRSLDHPVWQVDCVVRALAFGWAGAEAFREYALCRRRVRVGLAEPALAERFLLWGLFNVGVLGIFANFLYGQVLSAGQPPSALWYWTDGVLALATALAAWLAFAPPAAFLRRRARRARREG